MYASEIAELIGKKFNAAVSNVYSYNSPGASQVVERFNTGDYIGILFGVGTVAGETWMKFHDGDMIDGSAFYIKFDNDNVAWDAADVSSGKNYLPYIIGVAFLIIILSKNGKRKQR